MIKYIVAIAPWLTPIPTAWLIGAASIRYLSWPLPIAIAAALIIESLGLVAASTALTLYSYNRSKRKSDPPAPLWLALVIVCLYYIVATGLTVLMDVVPGLARYAPAIFPTLTLTGITLAALQYDHAQRLEAIEVERERLREMRRMRRTETHHAAQGSRNGKYAPHDASQRTYPCDECGEVLESAGAFAAHVRWKHAEAKLQDS